MARLFVTGINLNKNELQNARIQNLSSNPSSPVAGQIYFNNIENEMRTYDGTQWVGSGSIKTGTLADRPAASKQGLLYATTDTQVLYLDVVTGWLQVGVGADTVDFLTNKTIADKLYFGADNNHASYIEGEIEGTGNLTIQGGDDLTLQTQAGDIILNADGSSYIGSAAPGNRIVTVDELNSGDVIQSVAGTSGEVTASTDASGNVTVGLPDVVGIAETLSVGENWETETYANGTLNVRKSDGSNSLTANYEGLTINGGLELQDGSGNPKLNVTYSGTGATRITSDDDIAIRSNDGDIILYPGSDSSWGGDGGTGKAYVGWGNDATGAAPENEIATVGNEQIFTNKTINDELYFTNPSTQPNDGGIKINDSTEDFEIRAYVADLNLHSDHGDINLNPDGQVVVNSELDVVGNVKTTYVYGRAEDGGSLTIADSSSISSIHIDGTTGDIEIVPGILNSVQRKAFYGSSSTAGNEIAKISDIQALASGLDWKQAVNLLATTNINLTAQTSPPTSPPQPQDYSSLAIDNHVIESTDVGYRILLTGQDNDSQNGIYEVVEGSEVYYLNLVRASDLSTNAELIGAAVFVMEGDQYGATSWVQQNHYVEDFVGQNWIQFSGQGTYIGSNSIQVDGNQINALVDNTRGMYIDGDGIYISSGLGIKFGEMSGAIEVNAGTGLTTESGLLEFASSYGVRKYTGTIGDNSATSFTVNHAFGTRHVTVQVFQAGTPYAQVEADVEHTDTNNVTIKFASAPTTGEYEVVVVG